MVAYACACAFAFAFAFIITTICLPCSRQRQLTVLSDVRIYDAASVLGNLRGDVEVELFLKEEASVAEAAAAAAAAGAEVLPCDARVLIEGLASEAGAKLNGCKGRVVGYAPSKGRYDVTVLSNRGGLRGKMVSVRRSNLKELGPKELFEEDEL